MEKAKIKKAFREKTIKFSFLFREFSLMPQAQNFLIILPLILPYFAAMTTLYFHL
jgi:hypothetical protein